MSTNFAEFPMWKKKVGKMYRGLGSPVILLYDRRPLPPPPPPSPTPSPPFPHQPLLLFSFTLMVSASFHEIETGASTKILRSISHQPSNCRSDATKMTSFSFSFFAQQS